MLNECPFTSVVILHKDSTGIFRACPVSDVNRIGSRTYLVKSLTNQNHPSVMCFATMPEYCLGTLNVQSEPSTPVLVTSVSSAKWLNKVRCILLTAGGILLITKHKRLIGLAARLGRLFKTG